MESYPEAAVITGDIVASGALAAPDFAAVMAALEATSQQIAGWPGMVCVRYERFRGDGWQLFISQPAYVLRVGCCLRAAVRTVVAGGDTRLAIGLGAACLADTLGAASGEAFERSGQALERIGSHAHWIFGGSRGHAVDPLIAALLAVCDERSQAWTQRQAYFAHKLLQPEPPAMNQLAEAESLSPQTVQSHFARAGGHALASAIRGFEQATTPRD